MRSAFATISWATGCVALVLFAGCQRQNNAVSGTIEVDEVHVGPRMGGRVEKIFAQEGDKLTAGQTLVALDAAELTARRELAAAQINSAIHDAEAQDAQLVFMRDDALRQQDLRKRNVVSPSDAERAASVARAQEKIVEAVENASGPGARPAGRHRRAIGRDAGQSPDRFDPGSTERQGW